MSRRLQDTSFERSQYERPNREWICGRTGNACPLGPDTRGECITTHECVPYREGDRWVCARPKPFGGECEGGPLPDGTCCNAIPTCQPKLSVRASRGRTVRWVVAMTMGFLALGLAGDNGLDFVFPGPLTHQHGTIENDCASCHAAAAGGPAHWISSALAGSDRESDSERCLGCHNLGASSTLAHSVASKDLTRTTERLQSRGLDTSRPLRFTLAKIGPGIPMRSGGDLACALCHQEHQGPNHDLKALANDQCQVCHLVQFDTFAEDHPVLGDYPYGRRTRIIFDHLSHRDDYYPDADREGFSCVGCHAPESTGRAMTVKPFASVCGSCHGEDVRSSGKGGVAFLNVPNIDVRGLRDVGIDPGQWPRVEKSKAPSPFIEFLLAGDDRLSNEDRKAVSNLGAELLNVSKNTRFEQQAIGRYVWSLKRLLHDLRNRGHEAIESRLTAESVMGSDPLPNALLSDLAHGLSLETLSSAVDNWFPDLAREVAVFDDVTQDVDELQDMRPRHWAELNDRLRELARQRAGTQRSVSGERTPEDSWVREGGWYRTKKDGAVRYRSSGHADPFVRAWFDVAGSFAHTGDRAGDAASAAEQLFAGLEESSATGKCAYCHSVDPAPSSRGALGPARRVNWGPFDPDPNQKRPTEFRHQPHFSLDDAEVCDTCHTMREIDGEEFAEAYAEDSEPSGHLLNFSPIGRQVCGDCHTQRAANDDCVTCHNYHLGESLPIYLSATSGTNRLADGDDESTQTDVDVDDDDEEEEESEE